ncbi:MAG: CDF family Co(II)/Ni(II) efflux transporter DmeF [Candidatus Thermoplasmatota archaeon]|nr:CDF family Co(II)/Ni(II) efflux transporter DmeF [Euryarchaeota archaeon]MBU4031816.1 CDF family Co(II)/Ni(II) efflux transporter DmeF [Candidatus Thermoplasmatota archaeon]MBU4072050.1 CDF family Co(II)/Ni(II) efflux transporter DmeF [Candidatus Thermoplasmatota archaeon]MBU4144581.1 CDF family Co(II)/Ni(II) efflux transporter DmeF [Candidatus Thermoplasmatota archaeon]MBU4592130.1 CDF family Co(II)/Ni(II) efflux transporter DmeF [Candidatus Thermoplasmatota archaeon]
MNSEDIERLRHAHTFSADKRYIERLTLAVVVITLVTMFAEIVFGLLTNSMALLADGMHMGTHAFALVLSYGAYRLARKHAENSKFTFGTWKIEILGAYSSALVLGIVAIAIAYASVERLVNPLVIHYDQALLVAFIGLAVNVASAAILSRGNRHHHHHENNGNESHDHQDLNLKSAYLHVIADALTSIFAIAALLGAKYYRLGWLDPLMGILGATLIIRWGWLLLRDSAHILLDYKADGFLANEIKRAIESDGSSVICDLHLWKVGDGAYACIVSLVSDSERPVDEYKERLSKFHELAHVTIEINLSCRIAK